MTIQVLQSSSEISTARRALKQRGISQLGAFAVFRRKLQLRGLSTGVIIGDMIKSWDVYQTARFVEERLPHPSPILDIGAFQSEIICVLHKLGYSNLTGIDLNPALAHMPYSKTVNYQTSDFMHTPFADRAFSAITAISVIEHGYQRDLLLAEVSRLLTDGGYFIASFDYWPEKRDTTDIQLFNMSWTIFSSNDVRDMIEAAAHCDLYPVGQLMLDARDHVVDMFGKQYTFAWMVLQKSVNSR
jgi:SAM-dependent methyltransferase